MNQFPVMITLSLVPLNASLKERERERERQRERERERVREREKEIARGLRTNQAIYASPYGGPSDRPDDPENDGGG